MSAPGNTRENKTARRLGADAAAKRHSDHDRYRSARSGRAARCGRQKLLLKDSPESQRQRLKAESGASAPSPTAEAFSLPHCRLPFAPAPHKNYTRPFNAAPGPLFVHRGRHCVSGAWPVHSQLDPLHGRVCGRRRQQWRCAVDHPCRLGGALVKEAACALLELTLAPMS